MFLYFTADLVVYSSRIATVYIIGQMLYKVTSKHWSRFQEEGVLTYPSPTLRLGAPVERADFWSVHTARSTSLYSESVFSVHGSLTRNTHTRIRLIMHKRLRLVKARTHQETDDGDCPRLYWNVRFRYQVPNKFPRTKPY